ncbi:SRPBCC family protein [Phycicoccus flavus]|uniref:SRPBCC family protein n=1 Tax=Phycicoccus flavus TaxID=2502783 RepID=UPI000FEC117C|nr:SRPBCC family protein [Phycicoccus flavus]NHA69545.1 SRPBCC family protein [Phycicoccus flavus]
MDLKHDFTVPADVETTWQTFMDLERVGSCFPGATVTEVTEDGFSGTVKVKLGPIALQYSGSGRFVEKDDAAHRAVIEAKGKDKRGNGTAGATVSIQLEPDGTGTKVDVVTDLAVTGKPAQFGRGVMQDVSDKLLGQFVACIEGELTGAGSAPAAGEAPAEAPVEEAAAPAAPEPAAAAPAAAAPAPAPAPRPAPSPARPRTEDDGALDLGSAVLPVLVKTYAPYVAVGVVGVVIGWLIGRG